MWCQLVRLLPFDGRCFVCAGKSRRIMLSVGFLSASVHKNNMRARHVKTQISNTDSQQKEAINVLVLHRHGLRLEQAAVANPSPLGKV